MVMPANRQEVIFSSGRYREPEESTGNLAEKSVPWLGRRAGVVVGVGPGGQSDNLVIKHTRICHLRVMYGRP